MKLYLDTETFSTTPIGNGLDRYAEDAEVMLLSYAIDDGDVQLWDRTTGAPMPKDLRKAFANESVTVIAHNAQFDRRVMMQNLIFAAPIERWVCTQAQAQAHGLPGSLDKLCRIFGLDADKAKDKAGRALIHLFCKPNKDGGRYDSESHPEHWAEFCEYAKQDIVAMRELHQRMPKWNYPNGKDYEVWCIDQTINDRGFAVDLDLVESAIDADTEDKKDLKRRAQRLTDGEVESATQRDAVLKFITQNYGITLPDMRADTLKRRIDDPNTPDGLRILLELRLAAGRNSASKYKAVQKAAGSDGRLRYTMRYCGAPVTGRWSGQVFQPQNLLRPTMSQEDVDVAIDDVKSGFANAFYDNVSEVLGNCVRGVIVAPPEKKIITCDLSSIEGRGLAWLSGEDYIVDFFGKVDREEVDYDSYMLAYAMCFNIDPSAVTKAQRTIGKPIDLAHGYGGGVAAFLTFAMVYHIDLAEVAEKVITGAPHVEIAQCFGKYDWAKERGYHAGLPKEQYAAFEYIKQRWRLARPKTTDFWKQLANAFENAVMFEREVFMAGDHVRVRRDGNWMRIRLPSGRALSLLNPKIHEGELRFDGMNAYTRKWQSNPTHGGKLAGIVTQAFASDILRARLPALEAEGYNVVLTVHDEAVCEVPDSDEFSVERMREIMIAPIDWAPGLPLNADGFETYRYRKD